jgi:hypothetical protein
MKTRKGTDVVDLAQPHATSLAAAWESFRARVIPKDAGPVQLQEMRRAFYAGAWALHTSMNAIALNPEVPEDTATQLLESLVVEMEQFQADITAGRA